MAENPYQAPTLTRPSGIQKGRPTTATVLGVIHILWGGFGIFGGLVGFLVLGLFAAGAFPEAEGMPDVLSNPHQQVINFVNAGISMLLAVLLIIAGIGLLRFRPWGRTLSNYWAILLLIQVVASAVFQFVFVLWPMLEQFEGRPTGQAAGLVGGVIGGLVGVCISAVYPVAVLILVNRHAFRSAMGDETLDGP